MPANCEKCNTINMEKIANDRFQHFLFILLKIERSTIYLLFE